jgi:hypothetical protein
MQDDKIIVTEQYIFHWGVPKEIHPRKLARINEFAILEFAPRGPRSSWRYATNGMSSFVQHHPDEVVKVRTELFGATKERAAWVEDLLAGIATYPLDFATYLSEGDTINVGQPIDRNKSRFTAILLAGPGHIDLETVGLVGGMPESVLIHQVVGIFSSEANFAEEHGGKAL